MITQEASKRPFIKLGDQFNCIQHQGDNIFVGALTPVNQLLSYCQKNGLLGFEFMAGVPASVGGMIAMNFGCWGVEMSDVVDTVDVLIPQKGVQTLTIKECEFGYRTSIFQKNPWVIVGARLHAQQESPEKIKKTIKDYVDKRLESQPLKARTFGSVFKNPEQISAGVLIERNGLKGHGHNDVKVSSYHANFFENTGSGTAEDAILLIEEIKTVIFENEHIKLVPEVKIFK